ncbi:MAG: nickel pincer cofactor biosynthesis protein LarC [Solirubrobacterales bacterium]
MKILYYDCFSGISGDMNLGAMLDMGVDEGYLVSELSKLNIDHEFEIKTCKDQRKGIKGTKVDVVVKHHHHEHTHHHHRNLKDIENIINLSALNDNVKNLSLNMFNKIAEAEGKVHGKSIYEVHFHEVGAIDSIIDITGAAICLDFLKVDKIMCSSVELGGGFVKCAHGLIPVPAPATVEILKGIPVKSGIVPFETTTPTGAAILASNVNEFSDMKDFIIEKTGYGVGNRDTDIPNVLRVYIGKKKPESIDKDQVWLLECNIDDMNPELLEYITEKIFNEGALDVYKIPILMKKERLGIIYSVLCQEEQKEILKDIIFTETSTLGIREQLFKRTILTREFENVDTCFGKAKIKKAYYKGELIKSKPEYEDCKSLAALNKVPIKNIYDEIIRNMRSEDGK